MKTIKSFADLKSAFETAAVADPKLQRGQVWCRKCGHTQKVDSADALANGWPKHCGQTMTIDSPEERNAQKPI